MKNADVTNKPVDVALVMSSCTLITTLETTQAIGIAALLLSGRVHAERDSSP